MPRIKVDDAGLVVGYTSSARISFSLVSAPRHGRKVLRSLSSCRDFINDRIIADYAKPHKVPVDKNYLRLIITRNTTPGFSEEEIRSRMYAAKHIVNLYESLAKWRTRSKLARVSFVKESTNEKYPNAWLLTGPTEWMKSTHLVSMVTIIFRIVVECGGFNNCETLEQAEAQFDNLCKNTNDLIPMTAGNTFAQSNRADVLGILTACWPKFRMLMEMYDNLFRKENFQYWNPAKMVGRWHSWGGICSMCNFNMGDVILNGRLKAAWSTWQAENKK